jgi:hypothetical protein
MQRRNFNENGFGVVGVLLALVVLAGAVGAGVYVYHKDHKSAATTTVSTQGTSGTTVATTKLDPYAGWKSYCDTGSHYCFKYPANWTLSTSADQATVLNASASTEVDYADPYVHDGGALDFVPVSVNNLSVTGLQAKILGGVYTPANEPDYGVVDASQLAAYPVTVGQPMSFPSPLHFTDMNANGSPIAAFRARATTSMASESDAQAWFSSSDGQTSLKIRN